MKINERPKVSIILPVYNGAKYLKDSIDSCLNQSYSNFELIVIDDCSSDETPMIVQSYQDKRIKYIRNDTNKRLPTSLNIGFAQATGDYLTWTSDDNFYASDAIEKMVCFLTEKGQDFVYCNYYTFADSDKDKKELVNLPSPPVFNKINPIRACFMYSRKVMEAIGDYDPQKELIEDYDYWIRISKKFPMRHIEEPLYFYRYHPASLYCSRTFEVMIVKLLVKLKYDINGLSEITSEMTALMAACKRRFIILNRTLTKIFYKNKIHNILSEYKDGNVAFPEARRRLNLLITNMKEKVCNPKNIGIILDSFPAISEKFILSQITGLIDREFNVKLFANRRPKFDTVHQDVLDYKLLNNVKYPYDILPIHKGAKWIRVAQLFFKNILKRPIIILRSLNVLKFKRNALNFKYFLYAMHFAESDVIICHFGTNGADYVFLKDIFKEKIKYITVFHAYELTKTKFVQGYSYKELFKKGDIFLPETFRWKKKLISLGCSEEKIIVHRNGIDMDDFKYRENGINNGNINLLTVSRLVEKKGLEYSIRGVAALIDKYPEIQYSIVGEGPLRSDIEELIQSLGMAKHIKLLGMKSTEEIRDLMTQYHIFILTSVTAKDGDQEGLPVSLMEAMMIGMPIISTIHSGIPELITDGVNGFLVPERDVSAIIKKLDYLIANENEWPQIVQKGRKVTETFFEIEKLNERLAHIIRS